MDEDESDFVYSALEIYNHNDESRNPLRFWFDYAKKFHKFIEGNIFEFGVFKGETLISMALLLKRLNSNKIIYGFDSFEGFPSYSKFDDFSNFKKSNFNSLIRKRHMKLKLLREFSKNFDVNVKNISASDDFSEMSFEDIKKK